MKTVRNSFTLSSKNRLKKAPSRVVFDILSYTFVAFIAFICLAPFLILISASFTDEQSLRFHGYGFWPETYSVEAYKVIFKAPEKILRSYGVTIFITLIGTSFSLFLTSMTAYILSRKDFRYRNHLAFFFYFTTLFNGGLVSTYIFYIQYLGLRNNYLALILPGVLNIFYLLIMRSFISNIPSSLIESGKIDGAGDFKIYLSIILPLSKSGLATIGLFIALGYWNDWYNAMLYIDNEAMYPLQYMLYNLLMQQQALSRIASQVGIRIDSLPTNSLKMAMAVVATGPIILLYPFVQKYFVAGITIGAVKG